MSNDVARLTMMAGRAEKWEKRHTAMVVVAICVTVLVGTYVLLNLDKAIGGLSYIVGLLWSAFHAHETRGWRDAKHIARNAANKQLNP